MAGPLTFALLLGSISLIGAAIVRWLSNRPLRHREYSAEELEREFEEAYVEREVLEVLTTQEYLPLLLERLRESIEAGFPDTQVAALLYRISTQRPQVLRSAVFPIKVDGVASDLELQWIRTEGEEVRLLFTAVSPVVDSLRDEAKTMPATTTR